MSLDPLVEENIVRHDRIARVRGSGSYDARHVEIFNRHEQRRIQRELSCAWNLRKTIKTKALDFGAGTGNLSQKLLSLGAEVTSADVSSGMLEILAEKLRCDIQQGKLRTQLLSGEKRLPFADKQFGFAAAYSVLHHVPDYLGAVMELARILDSGGVLYLDHEALEENYSSPKPFGLKIHRRLHIADFGIREALERRRTASKSVADHAKVMPEEGDIHLHDDDHIEWSKIRKNLSEAGFVEVKFKSYLHCTEPSFFPWRYWLCRLFTANTGLYIGVKVGDSINNQI